MIPSEPKISSHPAGEGKTLIFKEKLRESKRLFLQKIGVKFIVYLMICVASIFMFAGFYYLWQEKLHWDANFLTAFGEPIQTVNNGDFWTYMLDAFVSIGGITFLPAGMMLMFLILVTVLGRFGVMGGAYQPMGHARVLANLIDHGMNEQEALDYPRLFWNEDGVLAAETGITDAQCAGLEARGHDLAVLSPRAGSPCHGSAYRPCSHAA